MLDAVYNVIPQILPFECLQARFMQQALLGLILLAPMCAAMGVQVVNFKMAFFSDAISHSAFAGVAIGLILAINPHWAMVLFGIFVGVSIMWFQRQSKLSSDTIIGVFFSAVIAFGLAIVSRERGATKNIQKFLYGDILTIESNDIIFLIILFVILIIFQIFSYNKMLYIGLNSTLAESHKVYVALYQYIFSALLSIIVIFSVWAVGVLLVTAMLVVPAATARNLANSAGSMFWWALLIGFTSAVIGLIISAQPWANTATGATIILVAFAWFILSTLIAFIKPKTKV